MGSGALPIDRETEDGDVPPIAHLEALNDIARIAMLDLELRPMLQRITDRLAERFDWEFVACITIDAERKVFVCDAVTSSVPTIIHIGYSRALGSGVVGEVAATERPIVIDDVTGYDNYVETLPGAMSELCIPIRHGAQLVAVLNLESTRPAAFHNQLLLVTAIADQVAGAIANARRYEELQQRARLMEMMSEVTRVALETTELHEVLERIGAYIRAHFPVEVAILLNDESSHDVERSAAVESCIATGQTQFFLDASPTSTLIVPIRYQRTILGVLRIESDTPDVFTPANAFAFEAFADQVAGAIHLAGLTYELEEANERLHRLSMIDALTGLANRRRFDELLDLEWRRGLRAQRPLSLLMIDIDRFKQFNDTHGHQRGDDCLRLVAKTLGESLHRAGEIAARYGGEEFLVLLPDADGPHSSRTAEMLRERVEAHCPVTISIGVAWMLPDRDRTAPSLIAVADAAMYRAKREGRNRVVIG
ncbi:MAG: Diguanylate cyclase protein [Acidobacteria bacterium]|nr:Diguanylate cyclase protein [Acidobacteriota bacterium]